MFKNFLTSRPKAIAKFINFDPLMVLLSIGGILLDPSIPNKTSIIAIKEARANNLPHAYTINKKLHNLLLSQLLLILGLAYSAMHLVHSAYQRKAHRDNHLVDRYSLSLMRKHSALPKSP